MTERLRGAGIGENIFKSTSPSVELFKAVSIKQTDHFLQIETAVPLVFNVEFPLSRVHTTLKNVNGELVNSTSEQLLELSDNNFLLHSPNSTHTQTMAFMVANWDLLLEELGQKIDQFPSFCYPEVKFSSKRYHNPDIVGYGGNGTILVVEIGVKGRGKNVQLRNNLNNLRKRFPSFRYLGIVARYSLEDQRTINMTMNYLSH